MRLIRRLRLKERGFTLIELIMTMVVVGIIAVPISLLISRHVESVFESQDYTIARNLARLEMEKVNNTAYDNISSVNFSNYEGYGYDLMRSMSFTQGSAASAESLKKITVSVNRTGSAQVLVTVATYIAKNISYGL